MFTIGSKEYFREHMKKSYKKHREEILEKKKQYYQKHKESKIRRVQKYYLEHKEKIKQYAREYAREYYQKNKEARREYYQKNKEAQRERSRKFGKTKLGKRTIKKYKQSEKGRLADRNRQHLKRVIKNNGTGITNQQWNEILRVYNFQCAYCGIKGNMTIDHVVPLSKGGEHCIENAVPACIECNRAKSASLNWKPKIFKKVIGE